MQELKLNNMFTQPAFIRKNSPELRKKLEELGYKTLNTGDTTLDAHNFDGKGHHKHIDEGTAIITSLGGYYGVVYDVDDVVKNGRINCGTNEALFLAIAALRDDSDKNQWFICDTTDCIFEDMRIYEFFVCDEDKIEDMMFYDSMFLNCHKATVEELVEHFKTE